VAHLVVDSAEVAVVAAAAVSSERGTSRAALGSALQERPPPTSVFTSRARLPRSLPCSFVHTLLI
jgi:hypothetical protein